MSRKKLLWRSIVIVAVLIGVAVMFGGMVRQAQVAARRTSHNCYLKQIGLAMHNHHDVHQSLPMPSAGEPPFSWRVGILPFVDQKELYDQYNFGASWDADENDPVSCTRLSICHWDGNHDWHDRFGRYYTSIAMFTGPGTLWESGQPINVRDIADGTSNTILVGEAAGWKIVWTEPRDVDVRQVTWDVNRPGPLPDVSDSLLSSIHEGGAYVLMADGAVRFLSNKIDSKTLRALVTPKGHEKLGEF